MITPIKNASNEKEFGELASKMSRINTAAAELGPETRIPDGFALSFSEITRLLGPMVDSINDVLASNVSPEGKNAQLKWLLANRGMPEDMKADILNKYKCMITEFIDKIPQEARHIVSGIREKPAVTIRSSQLHFSKDSETSFYNIAGDNELIRGIMRCWYSFFSVFNVQNIRSVMDINTAVLVQRYTKLEKTGFMITDEPITGNFTENEIVLLADIGNKLQTLFGKPQAVEFGFLRGRVMVLSCYDKPVIEIAPVSMDNETKEINAMDEMPMIEKQGSMQEPQDPVPADDIPEEPFSADVVHNMQNDSDIATVTKVVPFLGAELYIDTPSQLVKLRKELDGMTGKKISFDIAKLNSLMTGSPANYGYSNEIDESLMMLLRPLVRMLSKSNNVLAADNFFLNDDNVKKLIEVGFSTLVVSEEDVVRAKRTVALTEKKILLEMYRQQMQ